MENFYKIKTILKLFFITLIIFYLLSSNIKEHFTVYCDSRILPEDFLIPLKKSIEESLLLLAEQNIVQGSSIFNIFAILFKQNAPYFIHNFVEDLPLIDLLNNNKLNTPELITQEIIKLFLEYINKKQTQINEKAFKLFMATFFCYRMYTQTNTISLQNYFTPHTDATEHPVIITTEVYKLFLKEEMLKQHIYGMYITTADTAEYTLNITFIFFYYTLNFNI